MAIDQTQEIVLQNLRGLQKGWYEKETLPPSSPTILFTTLILRLTNTSHYSRIAITPMVEGGVMIEFWVDNKPKSLVEAHNSGEAVVLLIDGDKDIVHEWSLMDYRNVVALLRESVIPNS